MAPPLKQYSNSSSSSVFPSFPSTSLFFLRYSDLYLEDKLGNILPSMRLKIWLVIFCSQFILFSGEQGSSGFSQSMESGYFKQLLQSELSQNLHFPSKLNPIISSVMLKAPYLWQSTFIAAKDCRRIQSPVSQSREPKSGRRYAIFSTNTLKSYSLLQENDVRPRSGGPRMATTYTNNSLCSALILQMSNSSLVICYLPKATASVLDSRSQKWPSRGICSHLWAESGKAWRLRFVLPMVMVGNSNKINFMPKGSICFQRQRSHPAG